MSACNFCGWYSGGHSGACLETQSRIAALESDLAAAQAEVERRHGIGGELIIARRERDEARAEVQALRVALNRIAEMHDRDGNAIEMHRDELRAIAKAAL